jgi:hypothetical protein
MTLLDMLAALDAAGVRLLRTDGRLRLLGGRGVAAEALAALPTHLPALPPLPENQEVPAGLLLALLRREPAQGNGVQQQLSWANGTS